MADPSTASASGLRLAEAIGALSLATDLGMGQPMGHGLRTCLLAVRLGESLGMSTSELNETYYLALLRLVGCTADAHVSAAVLGDDVASRAFLTGIDWWDAAEVMTTLEQHLGADLPPRQREQVVESALAGLPQLMGVALAHCEVAQRLATHMGVAAEIRTLLGQIYERWDGQGIPRGLAGEAVARPVRVVQLAQDIEVFYRRGGADSAVAVAGHRAGAAYDPQIVRHFVQHAPQLLTALETEAIWEAVLAAEPGTPQVITSSRIDDVLEAMADFADLKAPCLAGHSRAVSALAEDAARRCGLSDTEVAAVRRAGLIHDLGRVGISAGIWTKPGPLSDGEWESVRLHAYHTERVLARMPALASARAIAGLHHERLDGSGYHRGVPASLLQPGARIVAAANFYRARIEPRPYRSSQSAEMVAEELEGEVRAGRLDGAAARAVLAAAGHRVHTLRRVYPAGLSPREVEVLRLVARGFSIGEVAAMLSIAEKTVDHHIQHIYTKIGVSTRAAAALFAMQHGLLHGEVSAE